MKRRRRTPSQRLAAQAFELSLVAPQVAATRLSRMAAAGVPPGARDRDELFRMGAEKVAVFYQSWANMWWQGVRLQWELAQSLAVPAPGLWAGKLAFGPWPGKASTAVAARVLSAGLAPVHRKAVANSKRLSRRRK